MTRAKTRDRRAAQRARARAALRANDNSPQDVGYVSPPRHICLCSLTRRLLPRSSSTASAISVEGESSPTSTLPPRPPSPTPQEAGALPRPDPKLKRFPNIPQSPTSSSETLVTPSPVSTPPPRAMVKLPTSPKGASYAEITRLVAPCATQIHAQKDTPLHSVDAQNSVHELKQVPTQAVQYTECGKDAPLPSGLRATDSIRKGPPVVGGYVVVYRVRVTRRG
ncbi:hypothetical protein C8Q77DRAFT_475085 [Trametes polyzona]|nr:hypothetical protein C8Q77DRAFT_475085 [Trametes polyzona]